MIAKTHKTAAAAAALACLVAGAAPAAAQSRESRQMMADLRILQSQTQELQNAVAQLNQAMTDALKAMNARIGEQTDANRKAFADQKILVDGIVNDLRVVRERIDDNNVRVGTLAQEVDALRELVTALAAAPPAADAPATPGAPPPTAADASTPPPAPSLSAAQRLGQSPQKTWESAMSDYFVGQYDLAISGFEAYASTYPKGEQADDAMIYIGHSYLMAGKYAEAVAAYDAAIRAYPDSNLLAEAYVRKGEAHLNLKDAEAARQAWEHVLKTYPGSIAAITAEQRIQRLPPAR